MSAIPARPPPPLPALLAHLALSAPGGDQPLSKASAAHGNLVLQPSKSDPKLKRWQRVEGPVAHEHVQAGAHFDVPPGGAVSPGALRIEETGPTTTHVRWSNGGSSWRVPTASLPQYVHDLRGEVHHPAGADHPVVDAVVRGEGKLIGKGNDGLVFRHGDHVVKAATVVPYVPENGGRTLEQANEVLHREADAHRDLGDLPHVQAIQRTEHDGRVFLVKPYLNPTGAMTRGELDGMAQTVERMHARGYVLGDQIQTGRDPGGHVKLMDLGQARRSMDSYAQEDDLRRLDDLYREHGEQREQHTPDELRRRLRASDTLLGMALRGKDAARAQAHLATHERLTRALQSHLDDEQFSAPEGSDEANAAEKEYQQVHDAHHKHKSAVAGLLADHEEDVRATLRKCAPGGAVMLGDVDDDEIHPTPLRLVASGVWPAGVDLHATCRHIESMAPPLDYEIAPCVELVRIGRACDGSTEAMATSHRLYELADEAGPFDVELGAPVGHDVGYGLAISGAALVQLRLRLVHDLAPYIRSEQHSASGAFLLLGTHVGDDDYAWHAPGGGPNLDQIWRSLPSPEPAVGRMTHLELRRGREVLQRWPLRGATPGVKVV